MPTEDAELLATSVLFIDSSTEQRTYWADQLKRCSLDHEIIEASDGAFSPRLTGPCESFVVKNTLHNVLAALRDLCKVRSLTCPYVFQYEGRPIQRIKRAFHTAVRKAGIKDLRFHDLRHCVATTNLMRAGVDTERQ